MSKLDFIFDGAMSTYYQSIVGKQSASELANISQSKVIIDIHKEYIKAGATAIKTNTFGLNGDLVKDEAYIGLLVKKAIENARNAVEDKDIKIFADIGPVNVTKNEYLDIVKIFEKEGINNFLFETQLEYSSLSDAIKYIKENIKDSSVVVSFAINQDGYSNLGYHYEDLLNKASKDADYVGLNCVCGPTHIYKLLSKIDTSNYNLVAMPNAGYPDERDNSFIYNAEYFSNKMLDIIALGIKGCGACCGSSPWHIEKIVQKINRSYLKYEKPEIIEKEITTSKSIVKEIFDKKEKLISVEFSTPNNTDIDYLIDFSYRVKEKNAHLITLVDSPLAQARADSFMIASKIQSDVNIEVMPHLTCRDKNQIAIKGSLLAGNVFGINNVLALSGDAIAKIDRDFNKGVFCFNSINLINYIKELNNDVFNDNPYFIGGALNVNANNFDAELKRAQTKVDSNVNYFITQSIFSDEAIKNLEKARAVLKVPIVVGLYPVASLRNALFLKNEVKGIDIPDQLIEELENVPTSEYQNVSINFIEKIIDRVYDNCDGFYISTPLKKIDYVCDIIDIIKGREG